MVIPDGTIRFMSIELVFLGTGTSAGVPMIGCRCEVCSSDDPRDQRSRPSALVRYPNTTSNEPAVRQLLIDTAPELRQQALRHQLDRLDAVLFTHAHADHLLGIDDLRRFNAVMNTPLDIFAEPRVIERLRAMFVYIFDPHKNVNQSFVARLIPHPLEPGRTIDLFGAAWTPLRLMHGRLPILGFRIEFEGHAIAYCTDVSSIPPETYPLLTDLDVLVIDALRYRHHPTHLTIDQAIRQTEMIRPKQAFFTHIAHDVRHAELETRLPPGIQLAYDGLTISLPEKSDEFDHIDPKCDNHHSSI